MTDEQTTLLYALSTFAQTCAALAAFVGAVGLFKLQLLRGERTQTERNIRGLQYQATRNEDAHSMPLGQLVATARSHIGRMDLQPAFSGGLQEEFADWDAQPSRKASATMALLIFEGWNLLVILVSLVGFSHIPTLAEWYGTRWVIWAAGLGTVGVTGYALAVWLTEWQPFRCV